MPGSRRRRKRKSFDLHMKVGSMNRVGEGIAEVIRCFDVQRDLDPVEGPEATEAPTLHKNEPHGFGRG